jgi:hypothetical protein
MSILIGIIIGVIGAVIVLMLLSVILLWLWNTTIPDFFGLKPLTFWQAFKLLLQSCSADQRPPHMLPQRAGPS